MTKPVNANRPGTLPCVAGISGASTLAASAADREAVLPVLVLPALELTQVVVERASLLVLPLLQLLVDLAPRLVLADLLFLAHRQV